MKITSPFSFYGGKSKISHLYSKPKYDIIIEPFAGSAAYAFRHWEHEVVINDLNSSVIEIWKFLLSPDAADLVEKYVPEIVEAGQLISDMNLPNKGLELLLRSEANRGTQGTKYTVNQITSMAAICWNARLKKKLIKEVIPKVRHWKLIEGHYLDLFNQLATWFIDPPYSNQAGSKYKINAVNFTELSIWCQNRLGQVIVCENAGANWLPFDSLCERRGVKSRYQRSKAVEVVWEKEI